MGAGSHEQPRKRLPRPPAGLQLSDGEGRGLGVCSPASLARLGGRAPLPGNAAAVGRPCPHLPSLPPPPSRARTDAACTVPPPGCLSAPAGPLTLPQILFGVLAPCDGFRPLHTLCPVPEVSSLPSPPTSDDLMVTPVPQLSTGPTPPQEGRPRCAGPG